MYGINEGAVVKHHLRFVRLLGSVGLAVIGVVPCTYAGQAAVPGARGVSNEGYSLTAKTADGGVSVVLEDKHVGLTVADGPCVYRAVRLAEGRHEEHTRLQEARLELEGERLTVRGRLAGLELEHSFTLPKERAVMEERVVLRNGGAATVALAEFEAGLRRQVTDAEGRALPELVGDRWVAVPLRVRATDPKGHVNDFSVAELIAQPGYEPRMDADLHYSQVPSRHRRSEGWAWTHGAHTLGIFAFCQEHMVFSVVSTEKNSEGGFVRFGGACMISGEPAALTRIGPGESVDLGVVRYQTVRGGYREAMYAYRTMLDEKGCRFPKGYNPPVHWEQLYDMNGAWEDRPRRYTREIVEKEAAKGVAYSCEALYLDPGWDTDFGTFLWGEKWLGPRREFVEDLKSKYGLKLALHCPLATWMSHALTWGPKAAERWPKEAARKTPEVGEDDERFVRLRVPASREERLNLALAPAARAEASSLLAGYPIHQVAHLNDGWAGNSASWIAGALPAWAQIDLGAVRRIGEVRVGNDRSRQHADRLATHLRILVATEYAPDSAAASWRVVAEYRGEGFLEEQLFQFSPVEARWVRVEILESRQDLPRLDEIEVYEAEPARPETVAAFEKSVRRRANPFPPPGGPRLCLGSRQYLDEAEKRLLANCADGAVFLMYDGNWWNGGCADPDHGHPVPYRMEDHIRANIDLVKRVHAKYPDVLIELHDPIAGGTTVRYVPVYYKYGLPGSYDENWGFELMWEPMEDLRQGRGRSLYYYNLGCNIPLYLHINLSKDNEHCVVLWWYASTCRHLGIGGTHANPAVVAAQKEAMRTYRKLDRFYKRGEFFGISEEIHLHVLPEENAFVVNAFNLSDMPRKISGEIELEDIGLDPKVRYAGSEAWVTVVDGRLRVELEMPAWSARVAKGW
jgi:hypothetical protein